MYILYNIKIKTIKFKELKRKTTRIKHTDEQKKKRERKFIVVEKHENMEIKIRDKKHFK